MSAIDIVGIHFMFNLRALEEAVCLEDHTDMGPVVHEEFAHHAWACIAFCLFVSKLHGSDKVSKIADKNRKLKRALRVGVYKFADDVRGWTADWKTFMPYSISWFMYPFVIWSQLAV